MSEIIITNAQIILADEVINGSLCIEDGIITDLSDSHSSHPAAYDFEGDTLIPGLIELHTDNLERHIMPRPKSYWPIEPAVLNHDREIAAAGITTVYDAMSVGHADSGARGKDMLLEMSEAIEELSNRGMLKVDHFLHWRCEISSQDVVEELIPLLENSLTGLVSIMDHTPGQRQFVSLAAFATYYQGKYGMTDDQLKTFITERQRDHQLYSQINRKSVVECAHQRNLPLASHDDATKHHVEDAIKDGIVVAEFPTTLEAARASHENGLGVLMGAPNVVRGMSHSGNVSARDLASHGLLDILSSDYVPFSLLYGAVLLEKTCRNISLPDAIATVTRNPAQQVGFEDRGEIAMGKRADLVRYHSDEGIPCIVEVWQQGQRIA